MAVLEEWMRSYGPDDLFDEDGALVADVAALAPTGHLRMSDNPHANGGLRLRDLRLPDVRDFAVDVPAPGGAITESTRVLGEWLTEVIRRNPDNFRLFGPDEVASNRLQAVYDVTAKQWNAELLPTDRQLPWTLALWAAGKDPPRPRPAGAYPIPRWLHGGEPTRIAEPLGTTLADPPRSRGAGCLCALRYVLLLDCPVRRAGQARRDAGE